MNAAEVGLLLAVLVLPVLLGAWTGATGRTWWWAAAVCVVTVFVAAVAPEPEPGESRLVAGDLAFLLVVAAFVSGLVWVSAWVARRMGGSRTTAG
jgi:hypothetical protein